MREKKNRGRARDEGEGSTYYTALPFESSASIKKLREKKRKRTIGEGTFIQKCLSFSYERKVRVL